MSSVYSRVSRSIPSETSLLFITESLRLQTILAHFIAEYQPKTLCIFIDFDQEQILQINSTILKVTQKLILQGKYANVGSRIQSNNVTVNKRKIAYQGFGFFSVSSVVFTLDLLCHIIHPSVITRVFIKRLERVRSNQHHYNWISQMIQRESGNCKFTLICNSVSDMTKDHFLKIYQMFCIEKIVIWPFGRKEIVDALSNSPAVDQYEHTLPMSKIKEEVQTTLLGIMKKWASGIPSQKSIIDTFTKELYLHVRSSRFMTDIHQLRILMLKLVNESYSDWLRYLYRCLIQDQRSLWLASSQGTDNQIQSIKKKIFYQVFQFKVSSEERMIKIDKQDVSVEYLCKYSLDVIAPYPEKVDELFRILIEYSKMVESREQDIDVLVVIPSSMKDYDILGNRYHKELQSIYQLLKQSESERIWQLKRIKQRAERAKVSPSELIKQNQTVLLEQLLNELQKYQALVDQYLVLSELIDITLDRNQLFNEFVDKVAQLNPRYIDCKRLKECQLKLSDRILVNVITNEDIQQTFSFRTHQPNAIIFYSPSLKMLRNIYLLQSELTRSLLKDIYIINIQNSIEEGIYKHRVIKEDTNFWEISKIRPSLGKVVMDVSSRVNQLSSKNSKGRYQTKNIIKQADASKLHLFNIDSTSIIPQEKFYIVIDKREFKSELPAVLFHFGFEVVPMFLTVSDYILSDQIQVERKQVATHDLHNSLRSGRLETQLKNMSSNMRNPYLLIQFPSQKEFNKKHLVETYNRVTCQTYTSNIRRQILQLLKKFPKVIPIWSQSPAQTAQLFFYLKQNQPEPDISVYNKKETENEESELTVELVSKIDDQTIV